MKKFKFKLESVHNVRELNEEKEKTEFARLLREVAAAEQRLEQLNAQRVEAMNRYLEDLGSGTAINPVELDLYSKHFASLERLRIETEKELEEKRSACNAQAVQLSEAARDVKVTGKLREKEKALFDQELAKHEQAALDEITNAKYARNAGKSNT